MMGAEWKKAVEKRLLQLEESLRIEHIEDELIRINERLRGLDEKIKDLEPKEDFDKPTATFTIDRKIAEGWVEHMRLCNDNFQTQTFLFKELRRALSVPSGKGEK